MSPKPQNLVWLKSGDGWVQVDWVEATGFERTGTVLAILLPSLGCSPSWKVDLLWAPDCPCLLASHVVCLMGGTSLTGRRMQLEYKMSCLPPVQVTMAGCNPSLNAIDIFRNSFPCLLFLVSYFKSNTLIFTVFPNSILTFVTSSLFELSFSHSIWICISSLSGLELI
jgi:hypothetical protein